MIILTKLVKPQAQTTLCLTFAARSSRNTAILLSKNASISSKLRHFSSGGAPRTIALLNGPSFSGTSFGATSSATAEIVFTTSLVGYTESLTDPSYTDQLLVFTAPLIGNYGVPKPTLDSLNLPSNFESPNIHVKGIIVSDYSVKYSHHSAVESLADWCVRENIPGITGVDTRALVTYLRSSGSTLAALSPPEEAESQLKNSTYDSSRNLVQIASTKTRKVYEPPHPTPDNIHVLLVDYGAKLGIIRCLVERGIKVTVVPWNTSLIYETSEREYNGVLLSNGPGDPLNCPLAITNLTEFLDTSFAKKTPVFGICMGHQMLGLAGGFSSYKMKFGNRGHNQPVVDAVTGRCYMTSQNHGYALNVAGVVDGWKERFVNRNDASNEGLMHLVYPWNSVQFHPEARGGPLDTEFLFDEFMDKCVAMKRAL